MSSILTGKPLAALSCNARGSNPTVKIFFWYAHKHCVTFFWGKRFFWAPKKKAAQMVLRKYSPTTLQSITVHRNADTLEQRFLPQVMCQVKNHFESVTADFYDVYIGQY